MNGPVTLLFKSEERFRPGMDVFVNRAYEAFKLPLHTHDAIEMSYVTEGTGFQYINDAIVPVKQGDIFLLPVGTSHVYRPHSPDKVGTFGVINCVFRPKALQSEPDLPAPGSILHQVLYSPQTMEQPWFQYHDKGNEFYDLFHNMLSEYRLRQPSYEVIVHSQFVHIFALLHRYTHMSSSGEKRSPKVQDAIQFVKHHFAEDISLTQVAEHSFLSVSHLQRLFKQATGSSFTLYVQKLRIKKCCELLKTTSMTVQQIAGTVGYQDMKYFHALFRQQIGMTPSEYRRNVDTGLPDEQTL